MGPFRRSLLVSLILAAPAAAETAPPDSSDAPLYHLDPVVVTAEPVPLNVDRVPVDLTVIGQGRLATDRAYFVSDAFREVPALGVQRAGGLGKLTQVRVRGANPRNSLVLFDGIPIDGPWVGAYDFADLMNPGIRRVEVLGGPASSLYGSGAMGGVIQILSPSGAAAGAGAASTSSSLKFFAEYGGEATSLPFGEYATGRESAQWSGAVGGVPAGAAVTHLTSNGEGPRNGYDGWNANFSFEAPIGADRLSVSALGTHGEKELPYDFVLNFADTTLGASGSWSEVNDPNNEEDDRLLAGRAVWSHPFSARAALEGELSGLAGRIENANGPNGGGSTDFLESDMRNSRGTGALRARLAPAAAVHAVLGAEYIEESVEYSDSSSFGGYTSQNLVDAGVIERALYAQAHGEAYGRLLVDAGLRLDDQSSYGTYGLPRVATAFDWREAGLKLRGGYGRAFMAPSLSDLYYPYYGNPALRPERSTSWEAGADGQWLAGRLSAHATWHTTDFINLIQADPNANFQAENIGEARIEGEEFSIRYASSPRFKLGAGAAHLDATNLETGDPLPQRPAWQYSVTAEVVATSSLTLTGAWRWVDSVPSPFNFVDADGVALVGDNPAYGVLDLGAFASLSRWAPLDLSLRLTNVLNESYSEVKGFPAPPRLFTVGATYSFDMTRER